MPPTSHPPYLHKALYPALNLYAPYAVLELAPIFLPRVLGSPATCSPAQKGMCLQKLASLPCIPVLYANRRVCDRSEARNKSCAIPFCQPSLLRSARG